jgi:molybdate transport system ATP-binding protein
MVLADRQLVLEAGRALQQGSPAEVARRPASAYVARLVGLNLWAGTLGPDGVVELETGGQMAVATDAPPGPALVSLRPSAVTVHTEHPEHTSTRNVWPGTVGSMEVLADRVRLQVAGSPPALADVTPAAVAELGLEVGREVWLSAKATEVEAYADPGRVHPPGTAS